jgi:cytochrome c-type biogenesis protein CcsB
MFFLNSSSHLVKIIFFTQINFATIKILLPIINYLDRLKEGAFAVLAINLNLSLPYNFFDLLRKIGFVINSFYDIKVIESSLESFSFFLLLVTVFVYWFETVFHSKTERQQFASSMVKLSNFSLTFLLGIRWITSHHFPLSNLYESLIFLSWSLTVIHLILEKTSHTLLIGVLLSPITLFVNGFALFTLPAEMQKGNFLTPALQSNWLMMHVTVMISSYAALLSGSILAIAFLVITRDMDKSRDGKATIVEKMASDFVPKRGITIAAGHDTECKTQFASNSEQPLFGGIIEKNYKNLVFAEQNKQISLNRPQLLHFARKMYEHLRAKPKFFLQKTSFLGNENNFSQKEEIDSDFFLAKSFLREKDVLQNKISLAKTLDNLSYRTIGIGFPLLTIGILSGAVWANEAWGSYWSWDPKETWALITWFLFAIYLHTRITKGLQGEKPAIIATVGFIVVWICFLGVNLASQGLHTYGWLQ